MTLQEILRELGRCGPGLTIYAVYPWGPSSNAIVARPRDDGRIPDEALAAGCRYFLEVHIASNLWHQLSNVRGQEMSEAEKCAKLIEYAEFVSSDAKSHPSMKWTFPVRMMIRCPQCEKCFDIEVTGEGSKNYRCSNCEKVQAFDLGTFTKKAIEQSKKMSRKPRGGR